MQLTNAFKSFINRKGLQPASLPLINGLVRLQKNGIRRIFVEEGIWIHETSRGYFAYHQPYLRLDLDRLDTIARQNFLWGYTPKLGDTIVDIGAIDQGAFLRVAFRHTLPDTAMPVTHRLRRQPA